VLINTAASFVLMSIICILFCSLPGEIISRYIKLSSKNLKESLMKSLSMLSGKFGSKVRLVIFVLTLVLFVLAAGAPFATGSVGG